MKQGEYKEPILSTSLILSFAVSSFCKDPELNSGGELQQIEEDLAVIRLELQKAYAEEDGMMVRPFLDFFNNVQFLPNDLEFL